MGSSPSVLQERRPEAAQASSVDRCPALLSGCCILAEDLAPTTSLTETPRPALWLETHRAGPSNLQAQLLGQVLRPFSPDHRLSAWARLAQRYGAARTQIKHGQKDCYRTSGDLKTPTALPRNSIAGLACLAALQHSTSLLTVSRRRLGWCDRICSGLRFGRASSGLTTTHARRASMPIVYNGA